VPPGISRGSELGPSLFPLAAPPPPPVGARPCYPIRNQNMLRPGTNFQPPRCGAAQLGKLEFGKFFFLGKCVIRSPNPTRLTQFQFSQNPHFF